MHGCNLKAETGFVPHQPYRHRFLLIPEVWMLHADVGRKSPLDRRTDQPMLTPPKTVGLRHQINRRFLPSADCNGYERRQTMGDYNPSHEYDYDRNQQTEDGSSIARCVRAEL